MSVQSLSVDDLNAETRELQKAIQDLTHIDATLRRHGCSVKIVRHYPPEGVEVAKPRRGRPAGTGKGATSPRAGSKNQGAAIYWSDVRRIAQERGISKSEAREVIRDRQKRKIKRAASKSKGEAVLS